MQVVAVTFACETQAGPAALPSAAQRKPLRGLDRNKEGKRISITFYTSNKPTLLLKLTRINLCGFSRDYLGAL